jgi:aldehyde:ferredoxin oxidoreductase
MAGWSEKVLDIDLNTQTYKVYALDMEMARLYIGGRGLGARLLWDMVGPDVDPLSPENVLIFTNGPLTGTGYQTSNRFSVTTKSPLTGTILDANSGGFWGMQFKKTGHDVMIVRGRAEKPIWIEIKNDEITFHDAGELWGMRVFALTEQLGQNNNKRNVLVHRTRGREPEPHCRDHERPRTCALARGGPGAVMGSKSLKAIVVEGREPPRNRGSGAIQIFAI